MMRMVESVVCIDFGGYETIQVIDFPLKDIEDNDVEVEVHYCGLNFADLYTRLGLFPKAEKPFVLGIECSGIIRAAGVNVTEFKVGDRVVCYDYRGGLHRSTVIIPSIRCYLIPGAVSLQVAAAAFVSFLTAHCCLWQAGGLQPGHQVLVQSCAGAVGSAAVQLARTVPQVVTWGTTSDPGKVPPGLVHHVLTHHTYLQSIPTGSLDLVIDNQAYMSYTSNLKLLKPFGRIVVIGANYMIKEDKLCVDGIGTEEGVLTQVMMNSVSVGGLHLGLVAERAPQRLQKALKHVWELLIAGDVTAHVDSVWPLETHSAREAQKLLQDRRNQAKVLLQTHHAANTT